MDIPWTQYRMVLTALFGNYIFSLAALALLILPINIFSRTSFDEEKGAGNETINFTITVLDKNTSIAMQYVVVILSEENSIIASGITNPFGRLVFNDLSSGRYILTTHYVGYNDFSDTVNVDTIHKNYIVRISEKNIELNEVVVQSSPVQKTTASIDMVSGRQIFESESYHASPTGTMTQLIQQNLPGAVKAPTGEVHIKGMHGEFTYLVDGIPIPLGVFGGLNEIVDPKVISKITFYTGGFPAEYGGQLAGLMDIQNKVPTGKFQLDISSYLGSYLTSDDYFARKNSGNFRSLNSNGQSLSFSDHIGRLGYFIGGSRQETDRRIDEPGEQLFHNHGLDYFTYGKFDYLIGERDYITMNLNYSKTQTQIPFDPLEGVNMNNQGSYNAFQTISYFRNISTEQEKETNLFIGGYAREGGLRYTPDVNNEEKTYLDDDTSGYVVDQNRRFATLGIRAKYDKRLSHHFKYILGTNYSSTFGKDDFRFFDTFGNNFNKGIDYQGYDAGFFSETQWHPYEWIRFDIGLRYDIHNSPSVSNQTQLSPRIKWNIFIDELNIILLSYDRLFMPTNIENLGAIAYLLGGNNTPTLPEKDNLYELSYLRNWQNGFATKLSVFHKDASPGLDDQTLGASTIRVNVNIDQVKITGADLSLTYNDQSTPFSGYINASLIHAYGRGPVTGGFLPPDSSNRIFDLDHDERLSGSFVLNYQPDNWFVNLSVNYASGLTNGNEDYTFKTGLFDFNQGAHTTPSWIFDLAGGYTFNLQKGQSFEPSFYVTNLLDHKHLLKGAFFSGASFEERRNVVFKLTYHL